MENKSISLKKVVVVSLFGLLVRSCLWVVGGITHVPLTELYILMFLNFLLITTVAQKKWNITVVFWSALRFTLLAFGHMASLSIISLINKAPLWYVYQEYYVWLAIAAEVILLTGITVCYKKNIIASLQRLNEDGARFRQLCIFFLFAAAYYIFDSIILFFDLSYWQITVFMLGSCLLINIQMILFAFYADKISKTSHYETEYQRLEWERAQQVQREFQLKKLAYKDTLTGAYNRRYVKEILDSMMKEGKKLTVAYIDINNLKEINDTMGHVWGDKYLQTAADCLNHHLHQADVLGRIGGDEFVVISGECDEEELNKAMVLANKSLNQKIQEFPASFSFGVVQSNGDELDATDILEKSDKKMYVNKTAWKQKGA